MELLASEGLLRLAWMHRWMFEENRNFVIRDFGRSFKPQGSDEDLLKYGNLIAERMMSYGLPESTPEVRAALDEQYLRLLGLFEDHLTEHPYLLGGHPSAADYALMGALHAHLGRDPAGLRVMQDNAPRTFRWVEHMLVPEVASPEFFSRPVEYPAHDEVPVSAVRILRFIADEYGRQFVLGALAFNQRMERLGGSPAMSWLRTRISPYRQRSVLNWTVRNTSIARTCMPNGCLSARASISRDYHRLSAPGLNRYWVRDPLRRCCRCRSLIQLSGSITG